MTGQPTALWSFSAGIRRLREASGAAGAAQGVRSARTQHDASVGPNRYFVEPQEQHWSHGQLHRVVAQRFEQTSDIAVNRVIKYAIQFLLRRLWSTPPTSLEVIKKAN